MTEEHANQHKSDHGRFSEDDIKRKLYGDKPRSRPDQAASKPAENKPPSPRQPEEDAGKNAQPSLFESSPSPARAGGAKAAGGEKSGEAEGSRVGSAPQEVIRHLQQDAGAYKETIASLEKRLRQAEEQNERLRKKISQRERAESAGSDRIRPAAMLSPDKIVLIVPVAVVLLVFVLAFMMLARRGGAPVTPEPEAVVEERAEPAESLPAQRVEVPPPPVGGRQYTIQVMEFAVEDAANRFVEQLKQDGYEVMVQRIYRANDRTKPYFKVSVGLFGSIEEARQFNEAFQRQKGIMDSFIREWRQ